MNTEEIIEALDAEIARLEEARNLMAGAPTKTGATKQRGWGASGKRTMSAAGRARIAAA